MDSRERSSPRRSPRSSRSRFTTFPGPYPCSAGGRPRQPSNSSTSRRSAPCRAPARCHQPLQQRLGDQALLAPPHVVLAGRLHHGMAHQQRRPAVHDLLRQGRHQPLAHVLQHHRLQGVRGPLARPAPAASAGPAPPAPPAPRPAPRPAPGPPAAPPPPPAPAPPPASTAGSAPAPTAARTAPPAAGACPRTPPRPSPA